MKRVLQILNIIATIIILNSCNNNVKKIEEKNASENDKYVFGIDISHYNGKIDWQKVSKSKHPIEFVIMRSTMGVNGLDREYKYNWVEAKKAGFVRGVYHYFRPNEKGEVQFNNFIEHVELKEGDLHPVLDVEAASKYGDEYLLKEVKKWLALAENKFKTKPIIYSSRNFYIHKLKKELSDYPIWIASYTVNNKITMLDWSFHQFTKKVKVDGIITNVDGNNFNAEKKDFSNYIFK